MEYDPNVLGTVAEWFSGMIAAIGIYLAIREGKVKVKVTHTQNNEQIILNIENNSNFDIVINNVYAYYYIGGRKGGPEGIYNMIAHQRGDEFRLKPKEVKSIDVSMDIDFYLEANNKIYIKYGCQYQGYLTKETKLLKKLKKVQSYYHA